MASLKFPRLSLALPEYLVFKRFFDFSFAFFALVLLSPIFVLLVLQLMRKLGRPVLFAQVRPGLRGNPFRMYKFRTMLEAIGPHGMPLPDAERITPFGHFLRASSLDELPELWNVLIGDMSLIGPRPLMMHYLPLYSPEQSCRHDVLPGITGWAQVNGRNAISWDEKFRLDVWYVNNQSFMLDLRIFLLTIWKVIRREGISASGEATMPQFTGDATRQ